MPTYDYPRPAFTVDVLVFSRMSDGAEKLLFIRRKHEPYQNCLCFPGGFLDMDETCVQAAQRELMEETSIHVEISQLRPMGLYDAVDRDPRGRTLSYAYYCHVSEEEVSKAQAGDDAAKLEWVDLELALRLKLGFDHNRILSECPYLNRTQAKINS